MLWILDRQSACHVFHQLLYRIISFLKIVFTISPGFSGHRCASLRISPGIAGHLLFLQARMVARRRSSPGIAGASRISFFLQDYIVFHSCLTISPGIAGHRWHRCLSCQGHLSWHPWASLRIAGHRIAAYLSWHRWASLVSSQLRMAGHRRSSPGIAGRSWITFFFYRIISCFILVSLSLLASPDIAGIAAYLSWHRWASFVPLASLRIAGHRSFHSPVSQKCYKRSVYRFEENVRRRLIESSRPFFSNQHFAMCYTVCTDRHTF